MATLKEQGRIFGVPFLTALPSAVALCLNARGYELSEHLGSVSRFVPPNSISDPKPHRWVPNHSHSDGPGTVLTSRHL